MPNVRRHVAGFTLIEVLVALAAMAVLAALAWRGIDGMLRAREITQQRIDRTMLLNTVMTQLRQDVEALADEAASLATPATLEFDGRSLRLVRSDGAALRVVTWARRDGRWQRWSSPPVTTIGALQEQWLRSMQLLGNEPEQVTLLEGVEAFEVFCRGVDGTRYNCQSTGDIAPSTPANAAAAQANAARVIVPRVVELHLTIGGAQLQRNLATAVQG